jgi:hypothetical protein
VQTIARDSDLFQAPGGLGMKRAKDADRARILLVGIDAHTMPLPARSAGRNGQRSAGMPGDCTDPTRKAPR